MGADKVQLESLPPELDALVRVERERPGAPERVRQRLEASLLLGPALATLDAASTAGAGSTTSASGALASGVVLKTSILIGGLTLAVVTGLTLPALFLSRTPSTPAELEAAATPRHSPPPVQLDPDPQASKGESSPLYVDLSDLDKPKSPRRSAPTTRSAPPDSGRGLLGEAQRSLRAGAPNDALVGLDLHRERHPDSSLREEREALRVLALRALGDGEAARTLGEAFLARYPDSLFRIAVSRATTGDGKPPASPTTH